MRRAYVCQSVSAGGRPLARHLAAGAVAIANRDSGEDRQHLEGADHEEHPARPVRIHQHAEEQSEVMNPCEVHAGFYASFSVPVNCPADAACLNPASGSRSFTYRRSRIANVIVSIALPMGTTL